MSRLLLGNEVVRLDLQWAEESDPLARALVDFLQPWFGPLDAALPMDLTLRLAPTARFGPEWRARCLEPFVLRRSSAAIFNLAVRRGVSPEGLSLAWDEQRHVGYAIDTARARADFYGAVDGAFIHLIELVRYYGLLIEQARGTMILHSAAVRRRDSDDVVALVGAKGAGKTTTMLSMLASGDYAYFSGDKLLLDRCDGRLRARGWPDYPHIGIGTLRNHRDLAERLGVGLEARDGRPLPDHHKVLLDPARYLAEIGKPSQASGRLSRVVLPRINEPGSAGDILVGKDDKRAIPHGDLFEWPHQFVTATWHGLPLADRAYAADVDDGLMQALRELPWSYRFGKPAAAARPTEEIL